jgi:ssDNA-binding Zn-finger/Zn-ribbon topoisomerase 1
MSLTFYNKDPCPKCRKPLMQSVIEQHPTRRDLAIHNFHCAHCGPVKTKIVSLQPGAPPPELAA